MGVWLQYAWNDVERKGRKTGLGRSSRKGSDVQTNIYVYIYIYIYYIYIYNMIIFTKHILRHVKQHKEPAL